MEFSVDILADSLHPDHEGAGARLTTMQLTYPRCIHSEFMTHRMFSRNAASSRAISTEECIARVRQSPFVPIVWGTDQPGMRAGAEHVDVDRCRTTWLAACKRAVAAARKLHDLKLHKQIVNRVLEPFAWITVICTGLDHAWENFFSLRCSDAAEPHMRLLAYMVRDAFDRGQPARLGYGDFHLPLVGYQEDAGLQLADLVRVSVARCARVSRLAHDQLYSIRGDLELYDKLRSNRHWSPFEHVARPLGPDDLGAGLGNIAPNWLSQRSTFAGEYVKKAPR